MDGSFGIGLVPSITTIHFLVTLASSLPSGSSLSLLLRDRVNSELILL